MPVVDSVVKHTQEAIRTLHIGWNQLLQVRPDVSRDAVNFGFYKTREYLE
jgi:hypothetical protein